MTDTIRITQPEAFLFGQVQDLLLESLKNDELVEDPEAAILELVGCVHREDIGLFFAGKKQKWQGVLLAQWNKSALCRGCMVIHLYNRGKPEIRDALVGAAVDYARLGGYDKIIGMFTDDRKEALSRVFNVLGEPKYKGQMIVFDLDESLI